jgi:hypothetical protein
MGIKHTFVSTIPDDTDDTLVRPSNWNADHSIDDASIPELKLDLNYSTHSNTNDETSYNHAISTHAPSNAQKNNDITKAEIEAKLIGEISSHTHAYDGITESEVYAIACSISMGGF